MTERLNYRMEPSYAEALGLVTYMFARLEWNVIWCCEQIERGSVPELQELTAGVIRKRFSKLVNIVSDPEIRGQLEKAADSFSPLVDLRNDLIHGTPITDPEHGQCLKGNTGSWSVERINQAADSFAECSMLFNELLHNVLEEPA